MAHRLLLEQFVTEPALHPALDPRPAHFSRHARAARRAGVSMLEMVVALAMIAVMAALAVPGMATWRQDNQIRDIARQVANAFLLARSEAIRTGNRHIVFLSAGGAGDPIATPLPNDPRTGFPVPVFVINDGAPGANNCLFDANEDVHTVLAGPPPGVNWGQSPVLSGVAAAPNDPGDIAPLIDGTSFTDGAGNPTTWVMFRADGIPVGFTPGCAVGAPGTGNGAVYITNGRRDYAIVLTALGGVRVHGWDVGTAQWRL
jgi:prepilin-type N-terminal cleavage/methylation domain-containing protein